MPCTMICLTPVVIVATYTSVVPFVVGAASALGFAAVKAGVKEEVKELPSTNIVDIELEGSSVMEEYSGDLQHFVKDNVHFTLKIDASRRLILRIQGEKPESLLREKGMEFAGKIVQEYAYDKAISQLNESRFNVVEQDIEEDGSVRVILRRWE